jgi:hypothetical protein
VERKDLLAGHALTRRLGERERERESLRERKHIANFGCERHIHKQ